MLQRADGGAQRTLWRFQQAGPQGLPGGLFFLKCAGFDEAVAIADLAALEMHHVQHAIALEWVIAAQWLV